MNKKLSFLIVAGIIVLGLVALFRFEPHCISLLEQFTKQESWLLPVVIVSALVDSVNPCAFSILLLTIAFLLSLGAMRARILHIASFYILGILAVYLPIGLGILKTLDLFNTPRFMSKAGAIILLALGTINIVNEFFPAFPIKLKIPSSAHRFMAVMINKGSFPSAFLLGTLVGLCEFPCTGGPYLMVLGILHDKERYFEGLGYLVLYNLIFILPLVIIMLIASNKALLTKVEQWRNNKLTRLRLFSGIAMILLGILILIL